MDTYIEKDLSREELIALVLQFKRENELLRERIAELEGKQPTERLKNSFSLLAEERRRDKATGRTWKQKSSRRGRKTTQEKIDNADRHCVQRFAEGSLFSQKSIGSALLTRSMSRCMDFLANCDAREAATWPDPAPRASPPA